MDERMCRLFGDGGSLVMIGAPWLTSAKALLLKMQSHMFAFQGSRLDRERKTGQQACGSKLARHQPQVACKASGRMGYKPSALVLVLYTFSLRRLEATKQRIKDISILDDNVTWTK